MTWDDLRDKPKFREVAADIIEFARGAEWIIHNAPFDIGFLDAELRLAALPACTKIYAGLIDTLALARELFPGKRNSLDALCERFGVDHAHRAVHGALLDAQLLAEVYLTMTRGQETLTIDMAPPRAATAGDAGGVAADPAGPRLAVLTIAATAAELAAHHEYLAALDRESRGHCLWLAIEAQAAPGDAPNLAAIGRS
jgi:DNA polymerase-3 subunit epsilon